MTTTLKVRRVGNSLGWIVPPHLLKHLGAEEGDEVQVALDADRLIITRDPAQRSPIIEAFEEVLQEQDDIFAALANR